MVDAGVDGSDAIVEAGAVESLVLSVVFCSELLHAVTENSSTPASEVQKVRAEIICVVLRINKWGRKKYTRGMS